MSETDTIKYQDAYRELGNMAEELNRSPDAMIDVLPEKIKRAIKLRNMCISRLEGVDKLLQENTRGIDAEKLEQSPEGTPSPEADESSEIPF